MCFFLTMLGHLKVDYRQHDTSSLFPKNKDILLYYHNYHITLKRFNVDAIELPDI